MSTADLELVRRLAAADRGLAIVSIARPDGSVQASLVNAGVMADPSQPSRNVVAFVARGGTRKLALVRKGARPTVVFRSGWEWVAVEGPARLAGPDDALDRVDPAGVPQLLRDVFTAAGGTHDDWETYDRVMADERRTAVLIAPRRFYADT